MEKSGILTAEAVEILEGLQSETKYISSKFFYDAEGSRIFRKIMAMPEYYLTDCEAEIFELHKRGIVQLFCPDCRSLDLVELGAGDGAKTRILVRDLSDSGVTFRYVPVDISEEALIQLGETMQAEFRDLEMHPRCGNYFDMIRDLSDHYQSRKVVLFLGSNLGNFNHYQRISFLRKIHASMSSDDLFFLGLDLKKDPRVIRRAYDDPHGLTRDFNLNLLWRINREMEADFDPGKFVHLPTYHPVTGIAESFLVSMADQEVHFPEAEETVRFRKWEPVFTEMSQKFDHEMIYEMASESGFSVLESFFDHRNYFVNTIWKKQNYESNLER